MCNNAVFVELVVRIYYNPSAFDTPTISQQAAIQSARRAGIIEVNNDSQWCCTEKGKAYVEALCDMPFPVAKTIWVIPDPLPSGKRGTDEEYSR